MLELREYTRKELIEIYKTELPAIKKKLERDGYKFINCGWGDSYTMKIISLPDDKFKMYCKEILKFHQNTEFENLKYILYVLLYDTEKILNDNKETLYDDKFINLQYNEIKKYLEKYYKISMCEQTISKYIRHLIKVNVICISDNYIYSNFDYNLHKNKYISKEEYKEKWKDFHNSTKEQERNAFFLCHYNTQMPKKRYYKIFNGLYDADLRRLLPEGSCKRIS